MHLYVLTRGKRIFIFIFIYTYIVALHIKMLDICFTNMHTHTLYAMSVEENAHKLPRHKLKPNKITTTNIYKCYVQCAFSDLFVSFPFCCVLLLICSGDRKIRTNLPRMHISLLYIILIMYFYFLLEEPSVDRLFHTPTIQYI